QMEKHADSAEAVAGDGKGDAWTEDGPAEPEVDAVVKSSGGADKGLAGVFPASDDEMDTGDPSEGSGIVDVPEGRDNSGGRKGRHRAKSRRARDENPVVHADDSEHEASVDGRESPADVDSNGAGGVVPDTGNHADNDVEAAARFRKALPRRYKIQEVIQVRQILLVQTVKEERGKKGVSLTTYLSLAGRYCVLMPNTPREGGISRKITNAADRKKLKEIAEGINVPEGAGLIVRTAGAKRNKAEIRRDFEFLCRQWDEIRELTLKSIAPMLIYEEGGLIQRSIRDLYSREIEEILVEGDEAYKVAKRYMKMLLPSHAKRVKHYKDPMPLFSRYRIEGFLNDILSPVVQLKSGGYLVIDVAEALVAIDVNSGRATKQASVAETALSTNLEAAEELGRQFRLRDLSGLIAIDFIDMDERRDNAKVERVLKEVVKSDRARIQIGNISGFGILEMTRQRLRPGLLESSTIPCPQCQGSGTIRTDMSLGLQVLRRLFEESLRCRGGEVLVASVPVNIANYLVNDKRSALVELEAQRGITVRVETDMSVPASEFTLSRRKPVAESGQKSTLEAVSFDSVLVDESSPPERDGEQSDGAGQSRRSRRRRRRRGGRGGSENRASARNTGTEAADEDTGSKGGQDSSPELRSAEADVAPDGEDVPTEPSETGVEQEAVAAEAGDAAPKGTKKQSSRRGKRRRSRRSARATDTEERDGDHVVSADVAQIADQGTSPKPDDSSDETTEADQDAATSQGRKSSNGRRRKRVRSKAAPDQVARERAGKPSKEDIDPAARSSDEFEQDARASEAAVPVDVPAEDEDQKDVDPSGRRRTGWWTTEDSGTPQIADK
ncbi:MAG: Rne/Rng family ribonuclease, partial [Rhodobacteraceae bacterium]|nr:Rne/Rng family ribonuclease [Paracoccaceae bacterium]